MTLTHFGPASVQCLLVFGSGIILASSANLPHRSAYVTGFDDRTTGVPWTPRRSFS